MKYNHLSQMRRIAETYIPFSHGVDGRQAFAICTNLLSLEGVVERASELADQVLVAVDAADFMMTANGMYNFHAMYDYEYIVLKACATDNLEQIEECENWCKHTCMEISNRLLLDAKQAQKLGANTYYRIDPHFQYLRYGKIGGWFAVKATFTVTEILTIKNNIDLWV